MIKYIVCYQDFTRYYYVCEYINDHISANYLYIDGFFSKIKNAKDFKSKEISFTSAREAIAVLKKIKNNLVRIKCPIYSHNVKYAFADKTEVDRNRFKT